MTSNRLTAPVKAEISGSHRTEEELRAWCWEKNQQCRDAKYSHWIYVHRDRTSGTMECRTKTGADALDVIAILNGRKPAYVGWDTEKLESEYRILRYCARMGMPEDHWNERFSHRTIGVN